MTVHASLGEKTGGENDHSESFFWAEDEAFQAKVDRIPGLGALVMPSVSDAPDERRIPRIGPCEAKSHVGTLLAGLLESAPQHCLAAVIQQMENLEREREEAEEEDPAAAEDAATVETEPLLLELHAAKKAVQAGERERERKRTLEDLLYMCVVLCFKELGLELTPALTRADLTVLLREAAPQVAALHSVHGDEAGVLVRKYVRSATTASDPVAVSSFQMRMPPMVPHAAIAVPHVFLLQMYTGALQFGYRLRRAQQLQALDRSFAIPTGTSVPPPAPVPPRGTAERAAPPGSRRAAERAAAADGTLKTAPGDRNRLGRAVPSPLTAYMHGPPGELGTRAARRLGRRHVGALFGDSATLLHEMEAALNNPPSVAEAQNRLDEAMRSGRVAWLNLSLTAVELLVLEAVTLGCVLWDVEQTFAVDYRLL